MKPKVAYHLVTAVLAAGCFVLLAMGKDSEITWILLAIAGQHVGVDLFPKLKLKK